MVNYDDQLKGKESPENQSFSRTGEYGLENEKWDEVDEQELLNTKLTADDINFLIDTIKKEAPYDEISIKQLFYGMCSAFTKIPLPHNVNSKDPGAGKSYLLVLVVGYFPEKYIIILTGMSDKAIFHRDGIMVIQNEETGQLEPTDPIVKNLECRIEELEEQINIEKNKNSAERNIHLIKKIRIKLRKSNLKSSIFDPTKRN